MSINVPYSSSIAVAYEQQVNILVSEQHPSVKNAFKNIKSLYRWYEVVQTPFSSKGIISYLRKNPKTHLLILSLGDAYDRTDLCIKLQECFPQTKVIFTVGNQPIDTVRRAKRAGAQGFIRQENCPKELIDAIRTVVRGKTFYCEAMRDLVVDAFDEAGNKPSPGTRVETLTRREIEVLREVGKGSTAQEIGDSLHISKHTVETHRRNLLHKLGLKNSLEMVAYAILKGYTG